MRRIGAQRRRERGERVFASPELALLDPRLLVHQRHRLFALGMGDADLQHVDERRRREGGAQDGLEQQRRLEAMRRPVADRHQRGARALVVGLGVEHLAVERERVARTILTAPGLGEPEDQRGPLPLARRQRHALDEERLDLGERAGALIEPFERVERGVVGAELLDQPPIGDDGARVVALLLRQRRHGDDDRPPRARVLPRQRQLARVDVVQLSPRGARFVEAHQRVDRRRRRRLVRRQLLPRRERAVDVAERALLLRRRHRQERDAIDVLARGRDRFVALDERRPAAGARRQTLELAAHVGVAGVELERGQLPAKGAGRVVQLAPVQQRQGQRARLLRRRVGRMVELQREHAGEPPRVAGRLVQRHQRVDGRDVGAVERQRLLERALRQLAPPDLVAPQPPRAQPQLELQRRAALSPASRSNSCAHSSRRRSSANSDWSASQSRSAAYSRLSMSSARP